MFTVPVGDFAAYTTTVRPSANTVVSGAVNNPANAYDADPSTYADFSVAVWTMQGVPGGIVGNPTIYITQAIDIEYSSGLGSASYSALVSTDGGTTYPYTVYSSAVSSPASIVRPSSTDSVYIPGSVNLANLKVKISVAATAAVYSSFNQVFDVRVVY